MKKILSFIDLKSKFTRINKVRKGYFALFLFFIIGFVISIVAVGISANNQDAVLFKAVLNAINRTLTLKVVHIFVTTLFTNCVWLIISYFLGVSAFGYPFVFLMPFIFGIQKGAFLSILLVNRGIVFFIKSFLCLIFQNSFPRCGKVRVMILQNRQDLRRV